MGIYGARTATPSISGLKVLESLEISAHNVELAALAGHPTLWSLAVTDVVEPVDVSPLLALPELVRLDLAGSAVRNLHVVCDMPTYA
ncbi:hypothetical protein ACFQ1S_33890 [Kibdelosporangium lantanae]|uniref:Leucine-rich repeat domain-containing protein n=1 Tax=Kibdelosporangium lantanae TaxID=1497396 RepID=A0ABW3MHP7_9PSEU